MFIVNVLWEGRKINYIIELLDVPPIYYIISICITVIIYNSIHNWNMGLLLGYCFFFYSITVLNRQNGDIHYWLTPFWSYSHPELYMENVTNIIAFIPIGYFGFSIKKNKAIVFSLAVSMIIEVTQLITGRGLFEFDDIIHNSIGGVLGSILYILIHYHIKRRSREGI